MTTVPEALEFLGSKTSEEIVELFISEGIRGITFDPGYCPVACYLRRITGEANINVYPLAGVEYGPMNADTGRFDHHEPVPNTVTMLMNNFDSKILPARLYADWSDES